METIDHVLTVYPEAEADSLATHNQVYCEKYDRQKRLPLTDYNQQSYTNSARYFTLCIVWSSVVLRDDNNDIIYHANELIPPDGHTVSVIGTHHRLRGMNGNIDQLSR